MYEYNVGYWIKAGWVRNVVRIVANPVMHTSLNPEPKCNGRPPINWLYRSQDAINYSVLLSSLTNQQSFYSSKAIANY